MILSEYVDVVLAWRNVKHFESLWYTIPKYKDSKGRIAIKKWTTISVKICDLLPSSNVKIEVQCEDCWETRTVEYADLVYRSNSWYLKTWETLCSACANHRMSWENNAQYKHWCNRYCEYRCNAKKRGIDFELTIDEFKDLVSQPCYYCWWFSNEKRKNSRWNWIDRINSNGKYSIDNCVPCCYMCNMMKGIMTLEWFKQYVKSLYNNLFKDEI